MKLFLASIAMLSSVSCFAQSIDYIHGNSSTTYQSIGNTTFGSDGTMLVATQN